MQKKLLAVLLLAVFSLRAACLTALGDSLAPYDLGVPDLHGRRYTKDEMNINVYWVQQQLKATGIWFQGDQWDCTGSLGEHTMQEVAAFMRSRGYSGHTGYVDQLVVNELAAWLGPNVRPVPVGGFYDAMDAIMTDGSTGSMSRIVSNLRDMVPRETVGARWVQVCLKRLGYYRQNIDGKYGEGTELAVKAFQKANGFMERDYVSLGVARAMLEKYYEAGGDLYQLPAWRSQSAPVPGTVPAQVTPEGEAWSLGFYAVNHSIDDAYSFDGTLRVGETVYFHMGLTGTDAAKKVLLYYRINLDGETIEENAFDGVYGSGALLWVRSTPYRRGTLGVDIYYLDEYGYRHDLGSTGAQIEARTETTQTGVARGWISGCDMYIDTYGNVCMDMTNYCPQDSAVVYFCREDGRPGIGQGSVTGLTVFMQAVPGRVYDYAVWCGEQAYAQDAATLTESQIPASAWISFYMTEDRQIVLRSASIAIRLK